ncbi:hypothetical protein OG474_29880 [Kribbella sp. NBC_01505]|uniref:hypothetical protein n=1 Tax=Kribbella sp. NBC_01505 TaxID=2903580 RepID=UPI003870DBDD
MSCYDRELIERLLFTVWDPEAMYGVPAPQAPPQDMPRGTANKKEANTLYAHLADMNTGWQKTDLRREERQAIFLKYGMDLSMTDAATVLDRPRKTVEYHCYTGVGKIVAKLNGDVFAEPEA